MAAAHSLVGCKTFGEIITRFSMRSVEAFILFSSLGILVALSSNRTDFTFLTDPPPWVFRLGQSYPNREETVQCRPVRLRITRNSRLYITDLVSNDNPNILFQSADARLMTTRMQSKLNSLADTFTSEYNTKLRVLQAWSEYSNNDSDPQSLHYEG